ncbi:MAG: copper chaperone PCu(A)C [Proteobacteria bacterium]|nr:copper chaperone PCu(A)C [Pseudomonadota bacterium]
MYTIRIAAVLFAAAVMHLSSHALADDNAQGIKVVDVWANASLAGTTNGAAFITLSNRGDKADRIVGVESPVAAKAELHTHMMDDGVAKMRPAAAVDLPAGETAIMEPGGLHVMLLGLTEPLKEGESFPLTLILERSGPIQVEVIVKASNAMGASHGGKMHGTGHDGMDKDGMDKDAGGHGKMKMLTDD